MLDALYPLYSVFAFLGFVLVLVPLPWHLQAWNSGTCFYMMWAALACLNQFVNSVVWAADTINRAPIWCDISIRITMAASVGIPAASLCINRRLYQIASVKVVSISKAEKRRAALIDALICVLFPLVYVAMQYIVQGHRFNIYEQIGCYPALYNSIPMYFISTMWPPLIGCVSAIYGVLSLRAFTKRRAAFAQFLAPASSSPHSSASALPGLTASRYLRLMALSFTAILLTTPLGIFAIWLNLTATPVGPWRSLSDTHFMFSRVEEVPAFFWRGVRLVEVGIEFTRWTAPLTALVFFGFFGFAIEARKHYSIALAAIAKGFSSVLAKLGVQRSVKSAGAGIGYTKPAPSFKREVDVKRDEISLPAYSPSAGTGSFTAGELKRAPSSSSSFATSSYSTYTAGGGRGGDGSSRFREDFVVVEKDEIEVSSVYSAAGFYSADGHAAPANFQPDPDTPVSASSFALTSTGSEAPTTPVYALPLYYGWADRPYSVQEDAPAEGNDGRPENGEWSPSSDAHSIQMEAIQAQPHREEGRAGRELA